MYFFETNPNAKPCQWSDAWLFAAEGTGKRPKIEWERERRIRNSEKKKQEIVRRKTREPWWERGGNSEKEKCERARREKDEQRERKEETARGKEGKVRRKQRDGKGGNSKKDKKRGTRLRSFVFFHPSRYRQVNLWPRVSETANSSFSLFLGSRSSILSVFWRAWKIEGRSLYAKVCYRLSSITFVATVLPPSSPCCETSKSFSSHPPGYIIDFFADSRPLRFKLLFLARSLALLLTSLARFFFLLSSSCVCIFSACLLIFLFQMRIVRNTGEFNPC